MRSSTWRLEDLRNVILNLGFVGENLHTRQIFDCKKMFDQYPNASVSMTVTPPEGEPYPGTIERDGDLVIWDVRDSDLVAEGDGEIQLVFTQEPHIARSYNARTHICRSQVPTGSIPSGLDDYITRADQLLDQVEDTFPAGGTTGQVLAKKSDTDYDTEWVDQGGGTEDYDELENRPKIGGVTLTGNKTLHDLGAASEADVEAKYTKPETGIPASDLAAGVIPDPEDLIDDTAGSGDTDKVWSADKSHELLTEITNTQEVIEIEEVSSRNINKTPVNATGERNNVTFTKNADSSISMSGTSSGTTNYPSVENDKKWLLPAGKYTLSGGINNGVSLGILLYENKTDSSSSKSYYSNGSGITFETDKDYWAWIRISLASGRNVTGMTVYPQLEEGATAHPYEDPNYHYIRSKRIDEDETKIEELKKGIFVEKSINPEWEQGSINYYGDEQSSDTRIRTGYYPYDAPITISIDPSLKFTYRIFDKNGDVVRWDEKWLEGNQTLTFPENIKTYRILCAKISDDNISPSDEIDLEISYVLKSYDLDTFRTSVTETNSMLGNDSVRAAKTINYTDGTPPSIDWYLVQSIGNKFYMSKDLKSKKYLFDFTPPSGKVSDWSAGITANNDIIFVADAAGLSTSANGRLSDLNRVNPVCFLASEHYSEMHVIDFSTNLKPCGWLGNVGFCVLPNGWISFCEYTRGTVRTANVWLISGDITDPENWTVTWSTEIIDTTDTVSVGIKHCHEMQFDFFTGILYFGTGDSPTGSYNYYSTDNGQNWTLLFGPDKDRCRRLTYVFTEDKVYWASDSYEDSYHHFWIADRDANGLVDVENAVSVNCVSANYQACYGCVYVKELNAIVMMDRCDGYGSDVFNWYCYDIDTGTIKLIGTFTSVNSEQNKHLGFRCKFVDWYPTGNAILTGFNPMAGSVNPDTNENALCGNQGGSTGTGANRINNLLMYVYKSGGVYSFRASTLWI